MAALRFRSILKVPTLSCSLRAKVLQRNLVSLSHALPDSSDASDVLTHQDYFGIKNLVTLKDLFEARVHLGHQEGCWNPHMKPFIHGTRAHHHIIDLDVTLKNFQLALNVLSHIVYRGGIVLFVSTHPRFEHLVQDTAREAKEYFVTREWYRGTLTNTVKMFPDCQPRLPDVIIFMNNTFLGAKQWAIVETAMANIPSIGIVDTDCDPTRITYPIPGNDDTPSAMELYCQIFKKAILNAKERRTADSESSELDTNTTQKFQS